MATIKEIANEAGVSPSSVSIVLSGLSEERKISIETQDKIMKAARKLGYAPNIMARRLRAGASERKVISVYETIDSRAIVMVRFTQGLYNAIKQLPDTPLCFVSQYSTSHLSAESSLFQVSTCNGAIICNTDMDDIQFLKANFPVFPVVLFNTYCEGYSSVTIDDWALGMQAAAIFHAQGCRTAAYLDASIAYNSSRLRYDGFCKGCQQYGIELLPIITKEMTMWGGYYGAELLLEMPQQADCLFCASEVQACGSLRKFREAGIEIPGQLKIIAIGNGSMEISEFVTPTISTFYIPLEEMASKCLELLLQTIDGSNQTIQNVQLPFQYVPRGTCAGLS